jgi:uncharacterized protein
MTTSIDAPLANILTLGVRDLEVERRFYQSLGWPEIFNDGQFTVFELRGALLALFPVEKLAQDGHTSPEFSHGGIRFSMIISVDDPADVDALAQRVMQAGGRLTKPPTQAEFFDGRDAYFSDPEGNYWEIAWAPRDNPVVAASRRAAGLS